MSPLIASGWVRTRHRRRQGDSRRRHPDRHLVSRGPLASLALFRYLRLPAWCSLLLLTAVAARGLRDLLGLPEVVDFLHYPVVLLFALAAADRPPRAASQCPWPMARRLLPRGSALRRRSPRRSDEGGALPAHRGRAARRDLGDRSMGCRREHGAYGRDRCGRCLLRSRSPSACTKAWRTDGRTQFRERCRTRRRVTRPRGALRVGVVRRHRCGSRSANQPRPGRCMSPLLLRHDARNGFDGGLGHRVVRSSPRADDRSFGSAFRRDRQRKARPPSSLLLSWVLRSSSSLARCSVASTSES